MQEIEETPIRPVEIEGYKALQYHIECHIDNFNFLLNPVFPASEYVNAYYNNIYKNEHANEAQKLQTIESLLGKPVRSITWVSAPLQYLFHKSPFLTKQPFVPLHVNADSFYQSVSQMTVDLRQSNERLGNLYPSVKKLAYFYKDTELSVIYSEVLKVIDIKLLDEDKTKTELLYMDFIEDAMTNFERILYRNVGIGDPFSLYENGIKLFNIMFRKQSIFNNRIFIYDKPRIIRKDDMGLDKLLTPLFILGWAVEPAAIFPKTPQQMQALFMNLLKEYLAAQMLRVSLQREDMAIKKRKQRDKERGTNEILSNQFIRENEDGIIDGFESVASSEPNQMEYVERQEALKQVLSSLDDKSRLKKIDEMMLEGYKQKEIARILNVKPPYINKLIRQTPALKFIRDSIKKR